MHYEQYYLANSHLWYPWKEAGVNVTDITQLVFGLHHLNRRVQTSTRILENSKIHPHRHPATIKYKN